MRDRSSYYTVAHPKEFVLNWTAFYDEAERMTEETRKKIENQLNIPYSKNTDDPKQRLDVYLAGGKAGNNEGSPVFIFLHGGGFREGDKEDYGYVASSFSPNGVVTVVPSYRWAPEHRYPAQVEDTQNILSWVYNNISRFSGDPEQIYIGGHSAGAILSAFVSANNSWTEKCGLPKNVVKGCVPISGRYDFRKRIADYYLPNSSLAVEASPMFNILDPTQTIVAVGSAEKDAVESSTEFVGELRKKGGVASVLSLEGMNHVDTVMTLKDQNGKLFTEIIKMIESGKKKA